MTNKAMTISNHSHEVHLPRHYLRNLLDLVQSRGGDPVAVLAEAGLAADAAQQPDAPLSWPQFQAIILQSCQQSKEPALGLYLGSQLTITTHGLLGLAAMSSRNLQEALELICQYTVVRSPLVTLSMQLHKKQLHLNLSEAQPLGAVRQFVVEAFVVALHAMLDFVSGHQYRLLQVQFGFPQPAYSALYQAFLPCPLAFDQPMHRLVIDRQDLAIASPWADPQLKTQMTSQCEQELQRWQQQQSTAGLVQQMLARTKGRLPGIEQVAHEFAMSGRTLRRRLADEQTSYQQLVEDWRQRMACHYLASTRLAVQQIAYLLGYADPANFGRAFRRYHGLTPRQYRQRQARLKEK